MATLRLEWDDLADLLPSSTDSPFLLYTPEGENETDLLLSTLPPGEFAPSGGTVGDVLLVVTLCVLMGVTVVGNVLVCLSVLLVRKLRKPQNYLLVSLALSDLAVALAVMPPAMLLELHGGVWPLNAPLCDLWVSADVLCCTASILNLCAISLDRYRAITRPLEYSAKTTPRRMLGVIAVVWLTSACVSLPPVLLIGNVHEDNHGRPACSVSQNFWYQIYATMGSFYVPLGVMLCVYVKILRVVAEKKRTMGPPLPVHKPSLAPSLPRNSVQAHTAPLIVHIKNSRPTTTLAHQKQLSSTLHRLKKGGVMGGLREHKASTVLGIIMSAFVICWLPFFILAIIRPFLAINNVEIAGWMTSLFNWLGYANSALNPLIYATLNRDFRRPFAEILCCRCRTLDSLMRREFYAHQYGDDKDNKDRRASRHHPTLIHTLHDLDNPPVHL